MNKFPTIEEVAGLLVSQKEFSRKVLIGGLLSFIPIINIWAFGYLYRFSYNVRRGEPFNLPEWENWRDLFYDGLRFVVVLLSYWVLPLFIVYLASSMIKAIGPVAVSYLLFTLSFAISPILFSSALFRYQSRTDLKALLDIVPIFQMTYARIPCFIMPMLLFIGIFAIILPLYGVAFFLGFILFLAYASKVHAIDEMCD
jgi:hypothetical protein